jgi:hypothetical protein
MGKDETIFPKTARAKTKQRKGNLFSTTKRGNPAWFGGIFVYLQVMFLKKRIDM